MEKPAATSCLPESLAALTKRLREEREWSQGDLARRAQGVSVVTICQIESGHVRHPLTGTSYRLARAFGLSADAAIEYMRVAGDVVSSAYAK